MAIDDDGFGGSERASGTDSGAVRRDHHVGVGEFDGPRCGGLTEVDQHRQAGVVEHTVEPDDLAVGRRELDGAAPQHLVVVAQSEQLAVQRVHRLRFADLG